MSLCCCCKKRNSSSESTCEEAEAFHLESSASTQNSPRKSDKFLVQFDYGVLKKGDFLETLQDNSDTQKIILVKNLYTGVSAYVPLAHLAKVCDFEEEPWAFPDVDTRTEADCLLTNAPNENGTFLVRPCIKEGIPYVLSVKHYDKETSTFVNEHYHIFKKDNHYGKQGQEVFVTLGKMLETFIDNGFITKPCPKHVNIELTRSDILFEEESPILGEGAFGQVHKAKWQTLDVAVKKLKKASNSKEVFMKEIQVMNQFRHKNIVKMYGVCTLEEPLLMVFEYMALGSLKNYIEKELLTLEENQKVLQQICEGMMYLEKYQIVHRDLAARNILVGHELSVKIGDFGLSRALYDNQYICNRPTLLPIRWLAIESLNNHVFSTQSDVWMFGILVMEVYTRGRMPYNEIVPWSIKIFLKKVNDGYRMTKPTGMPKNVYDMVSSCWLEEPSKRPTFRKLYEFFNS